MVPGTPHITTRALGLAAAMLFLAVACGPPAVRGPVQTAEEYLRSLEAGDTTAGHAHLAPDAVPDLPAELAEALSPSPSDGATATPTTMSLQAPSLAAPLTLSWRDGTWVITAGFGSTLVCGTPMATLVGLVKAVDEADTGALATYLPSADVAAHGADVIAKAALASQTFLASIQTLAGGFDATSPLPEGVPQPDGTVRVDVAGVAVIFVDEGGCWKVVDLQPVAGK